MGQKSIEYLAACPRRAGARHRPEIAKVRELVSEKERSGGDPLLDDNKPPACAPEVCLSGSLQCGWAEPARPSKLKSKRILCRPAAVTPPVTDFLPIEARPQQSDCASVRGRETSRVSTGYSPEGIPSPFPHRYRPVLRTADCNATRVRQAAPMRKNSTSACCDPVSRLATAGTGGVGLLAAISPA